jgi:WD40 repeat protein
VFFAVYSHSYAVTGAEDHKLRLWPLDFTDFLLEAQHEGVVTNIRISLDGRKLAIGTNAGTLGVLNVSEHSYNTVLRCVRDVMCYDLL